MQEILKISRHIITNHATEYMQINKQQNQEFVHKTVASLTTVNLAPVLEA